MNLLVITDMYTNYLLIFIFKKQGSCGKIIYNQGSTKMLQGGGRDGLKMLDLP